MKKLLILSLLLTSTTSTFANEPQRPALPIKQMFDAMREHDGAKLLAQFSQQAKLERITKENKIHQSDLAKFVDTINQSSKYLDEQLLEIKVSQSDNLASVWTPYAFYLDGKLSHCGVNSFQVIQQDGQWKIHYLIDNVHQGDCQQFIAQYQTK